MHQAQQVCARPGEGGRRVRPLRETRAGAPQVRLVRRFVRFLFVCLSVFGPCASVFILFVCSSYNLSLSLPLSVLNLFFCFSVRFLSLCFPLDFCLLVRLCSVSSTFCVSECPNATILYPLICLKNRMMR